MHEMSICQTLIEQVAGELRNAGHAGRVTQLELIVGRMSGVHVHSLQFAFEVLAPGSVVEGAELVIHEPRAECVCQSCGARREIEFVELTCEACGSGDVRIEGGRDLMLQSIELDDAA